MKKIYDIDMADEARKGHMIKERYQMLAEDPFEILKYLMTHDVDQDYSEISIKECECRYEYYPKEFPPEFTDFNYNRTDEPWARWRVGVYLRPEDRFTYYDMHEILARTKAEAITDAVRRSQKLYPDAVPVTELKVFVERNDRKPLNFSI